MKIIFMLIKMNFWFLWWICYRLSLLWWKL